MKNPGPQAAPHGAHRCGKAAKDIVALDNAVCRCRRPIDPTYGGVVLTAYTQPFNEVDSTYYHRLYERTVATLDFGPPTTPPTPPSTPGTAIRRVPTRPGWPPSRSTRAAIPRPSACPTACPCARKGCS